MFRPKKHIYECPYANAVNIFKVIAMILLVIVAFVFMFFVVAYIQSENSRLQKTIFYNDREAKQLEKEIQNMRMNIETLSSYQNIVKKLQENGINMKQSRAIWIY